MNFLAHLLLADRVQLPLAGAILGDVVRGRIESDAVQPPTPGARRYPPALALSIRLHRRLDTVTDAHPCVLAAIADFPDGARRYAGIVLDLLHDHALALDWPRFGSEPLEAFARRAADEIVAARTHFLEAPSRAPDADGFARLLRSYADAAGLDRAIQRTAARLKKPQGLLDAAADWRMRLTAARRDLPDLMRDLAAAAARFVADEDVAQAGAGATPASVSRRTMRRSFSAQSCAIQAWKRER